MRLRTKRLLLYLFSAALLASATAAVVWVLLWPLPSFDFQPSPPEVPLAAAGGRPSRPTLEEFRLLWDKPLQRALVDPPPESPPQPAPVARRSRHPVTLLGTMIEPGASMAVLATPTEGIHVLRIGEKLGQQEDAPRVARIDDEAVDLEYGDESVTLMLKEQ